MGLTNKGTLYSLVHHSNFTAVVRSDIQVAAFDFAKGQFLSTPVLAVQTFVGANNFPAWSPDGKYLAFLRAEMAQGRTRTVIMILSHETGQLRELQSQLNIYSGGGSMRWSPDGLSLAIRATSSKGRQGVFRIDTATGEATPIALSTEGEILLDPMWAPDGKRIYYRRMNRPGQFTVIVERDLSSGNEKEVIRRSARAPYGMDLDLSPDGRYWVAVEGDWYAPPVALRRTGKWNVLLIPTSGGEPKELMRGESHGAGVLMWAPDSRSIFVYSLKDNSTDDREVWRVAIDGTESQKLGLNANFLGPGGNSDQQFHVHPDGKRVVFAAAEPAKPGEVWALENFLPAVSAAR
jgi:dipeptidyl aminopeptidase/acylaminoacyl peptidase